MKALEKKVYIYSTGCFRRLLDARKISDYFKINQYRITSNPKKADFILVNTCAIKKSQEDFSVKKIQEFKKYNKKLIVCGCLPGMNEERLKTVFDGPTFTPASMEKIDEIFNPEIKFKDFPDPHFLIKPLFFDPVFRNDIFRFDLHGFKFAMSHLIRRLQGEYFIKVASGCLGRCTYCTIKKATGALKCKPPEKCLGEFKEGISRGYKKFVILGDDVGAYGLDIGETLPNLLNKFLEIKENYKISIHDLNPRWVIKYQDQLVKIVKSGKIDKIFCPVQSGSNKILNLMQRFNTREEIREALFKIKKSCPKLEIFTHVMIGFPGEDEEDFEETLNLLKEMNFDYVMPCLYSEAPNAPSAVLPNKVSLEVAKQRLKRIKRFLRHL